MRIIIASISTANKTPTLIIPISSGVTLTSFSIHTTIYGRTARLGRCASLWSIGWASLT